MQKKNCYRTIAAIIIIIIFFVGFHMYNHLQIQSRRFTNEWGRGINIDTCGINYAPLMSVYKDRILIVGFEKDGSLSYTSTEYDGDVIESGNVELEDFSKNKTKYIDIVENNLLYVKDSNLYKTAYTEGKGFGRPEILLSDVAGFNISKIDGETWIQVFNKDMIKLYTFNNEKLNLNQSFENLWNIKSIFLRSNGNQKYLFLLNKVDDVTDEILAGRLEDIKNNSLKNIREIKYLSQVYIEEINIEHYNNEFYIVYGIREILPGGERNTNIGFSVVDDKELNVKVNERLYHFDIKGIAGLDSNIALFTDKSGVKIVGSAINLNNKYAENNDIFILDINGAGRVKNVNFISNTEKYSKTPRIIDTSYGRYLSWLDVVGGGYKIMLNSTNDDFKKNTIVFTTEDYKNAFLKAISAPILALVSTFLIGNKMLLYIGVLFLPVGYMARKKGIENEKVKFLMFIGLYIILNILTFKGTYYSGLGSVYIPDILRIGLISYAVPLFINLLSAVLLYLFHKDKRNLSYLIYVLFFIGIDIYLINFFYVPFTMIKIL